MRKFLYSILAAGALMFAAAGCSDSNEVDTPDDPDGPSTPGGTPAVTLYTADCAGTLTAAEWANVKKWSAEEWADVKWTATSVVDLVRYEESEGDFDSGVYAHIIKVVRKNYDYAHEIVLDPAKIDWFQNSSNEAVAELEDGAVFLIKADNAKLNSGSETKADMTLLTDDGKELTKVTFRVEPATDVVTVAAVATGPWTADVTLTHLGTAQAFVFGIIPAKDDEAKEAFIEAAKESMNLSSERKNPYYTYSLETVPFRDAADYEITDKTWTVSELRTARENAAALRPSTEYKAVVFACNLDEASEDGMTGEFVFAGGPSYYKVVEANFTTPAWEGAETADINYETLRHNSVRADMKFTVPATYAKVLYGCSTSDVAVADWSSVEGVEFAANTGEPFEFTGKFAGKDKLNFFVAGITAEGKVSYRLMPMQKGPVAFDSIESFKEFRVLVEKTEDYVKNDGTVTLNDASIGVQFTEHDNGTDKITAKIKENRYIYTDKPMAYADVVANLTDESEETTKHVKAEGDLALTVTLVEGVPGKYAKDYYIYVMLVDEDGNYGEIVYLTNEAEGNFEVLAEGGEAKALTLEWVAPEESNLNYAIWAQTVKGGNVNEWLNLKDVKTVYAGYYFEATIASTATADNADKVYICTGLSDKFRGVTGNALTSAVVDFLTERFEGVPTGDDESDKNQLHPMLYAVGPAGQCTHYIGFASYLDNDQGNEATVIAVVVVDKEGKLTLKALGWATRDNQPVLVDMTDYTFPRK